MLGFLGYIGCLVAIAPATALGFYFWGVSRLANAGNMVGLGRIALRLLELIGTPSKLIAIVVVILAILLAGCLRSTRPVGCTVLGAIGVMGLVQVLVIDRSPNAWLLMSPSIVGVSACFWWAWKMLATATA